jgi:hypothetical protein
MDMSLAARPVVGMQPHRVRKRNPLQEVAHDSIFHRLLGCSTKCQWLGIPDPFSLHRVERQPPVVDQLGLRRLAASHSASSSGAMESHDPCQTRKITTSLPLIVKRIRYL